MGQEHYDAEDVMARSLMRACNVSALNMRQNVGLSESIYPLVSFGVVVYTSHLETGRWTKVLQMHK